MVVLSGLLRAGPLTTCRSWCLTDPCFAHGVFLSGAPRSRSLTALYSSLLPSHCRGCRGSLLWLATAKQHGRRAVGAHTPRPSLGRRCPGGGAASAGAVCDVVQLLRTTGPRRRLLGRLAAADVRRNLPPALHRQGVVANMRVCMLHRISGGCNTCVSGIEIMRDGRIFWWTVLPLPYATR